MKSPLLVVSVHVTFLVVFLLPNTSEALPDHDEIPGEGSEVWHDTAVEKFYGPWSDAHEVYGETADDNDYGPHIQDFEPGPEDEPEVAESEAADFQSNYGEIGGDEFNAPFQPSPDDQSTGNQDVEDDGDQAAGGDTENSEFEGNVQWTSAAV